MPTLFLSGHKQALPSRHARSTPWESHRTDGAVLDAAIALRNRPDTLCARRQTERKRSPMDRVNSSEDVGWDQKLFDEGVSARKAGTPIEDHPDELVAGRFAVRSWRAGWCDADKSLT